MSTCEDINNIVAGLSKVDKSSLRNALLEVLQNYELKMDEMSYVNPKSGGRPSPQSLPPA